MLSRKEKERDRDREQPDNSDAHNNADDAAKDPNTNSVAGPGPSLARATPPLPSQSTPSGSVIDPLSQVSLWQPARGPNSARRSVTTTPISVCLFPRIAYGDNCRAIMAMALAPVASSLAVVGLHALPVATS